MIETVLSKVGFLFFGTGGPEPTRLAACGFRYFWLSV
jgi:hypothetical protein